MSEFLCSEQETFPLEETACEQSHGVMLGYSMGELGLEVG